MDAQHISQLDDEQYDALVTGNAHPPTRDAEAWAALTHPTNIQRTRATLTLAFQRVSATMRKRRAEQDVFHSECYQRGEAGKQDWFAAKGEYEEWRRRAGNFQQSMQAALRDLGKTQKDINRSMNHQIAQNHRETLRKLAVAVQQHQAQHAKAGGVAEQCDYELWQLLDQLTVPCGPDNSPITLRNMLEVYWMDVETVTAQGAAEEQAEAMMRSVPAGQSSRYSGVPRARHVGNDKQLA